MKEDSFTMIRSLSGRERCVTLAAYLIENKSTVRGVASYFGISKSTVHKDITQCLKHIDKNMHQQVKEILDTNKKERHIRGGEATKRKYIKQAELYKTHSTEM